MRSPGEPFDRSLPSPLAALMALRAAGEDSVVATDALSPRQQSMYVYTELDERLLAIAQDPGLTRLILLSGSSGGGKSALIRQLVRAAPRGTFSTVIEDATHAESPSEDQTGLLATALGGFREGVPPGGELILLAANTGLLLRLERAFRLGGEPGLAELAAHSLRTLGVPAAPRIQAGRAAELAAAVLVADLDQRPTSGGESRLLRRMLRALDPGDADGVMDGSPRCGTCQVRSWCSPRANAELMADPAVGASLDEAVQQVALQRGREVPPRQMWDGLAELALGGLDALAGDPCDAVASAATRQDRVRVWDLLLPNGALARPQGPLTRSLASLDPSYQPSGAAHDVIASTGVDPREDGQQLLDLLTLPGPAPGAVLTASSYLESRQEQDPSPGRGLARAAWLAGKLSLGPAVPESFRRALEGDESAIVEVLAGTVAPGLVQAFGQGSEGESYLPTESLAESRQARVLVQVPVLEFLDFQQARTFTANPRGSRAIGARPLRARVAIGQTWLDLDLPLFALLEQAGRGALTSTVDVERFHAMRHAIERLGRSEAGDGKRPLLIVDGTRGTAYRARVRLWRGKQQLQITRVG